MRVRIAPYLLAAGMLAALCSCSLLTHTKVAPRGFPLKAKAPNGWVVDTARSPASLLLRAPDGQSGMHALALEGPATSAEDFAALLPGVLRQQLLPTGYRPLPVDSTNQQLLAEWLFGQGAPGTEAHTLRHAWAWHQQHKGHHYLLVAWGPEDKPKRYLRWLVQPTRRSLRSQR